MELHENTLDEFAERIKEGREQMGVSQKELSGRAEVSNKHLSQIEGGKSEAISPDRVIRICAALGLDVEHWIREFHLENKISDDDIQINLIKVNKKRPGKYLFQGPGIDVISGKEFEEEWGEIVEYTKKLKEEGDTERVKISTKNVVNFFHNPLEVYNGSFFDGIESLLERDYRILWVYSGQEAPDLESDMKRKIRMEIGDDFVDLCRFMKMEDHEEDLPINFCVFAPLVDGRTLGYMTLPSMPLTYHSGAGSRTSVMKIRRPEVTNGKLDRYSRRLLARSFKAEEEEASDGQGNGPWSELRKMMSLGD